MIGIKEMFMPKTCIECPFYCGTANGTCLVDANSYNSRTMHDKEYERQDWCPLVEINENEGE